MFQKIKEFLFGKLPAEQTPSAPVEAVPYKVETPAPVEASAPQCGCGRSPTGLCVGLHKLSADEWAVHADNPAKVAPAKKQTAAKPAAKAAAKPAPAKKPAAKPAAMTASKKRTSKKTPG